MHDHLKIGTDVEDASGFIFIAILTIFFPGVEIRGFRWDFAS